MGHRHSIYQYSPDEDLCVDCQRLFGTHVLTRKERVKAKFHLVNPVPLLQAILEDMTKLWGGISQPVRRLQDFASFATVLSLFEKVEEGMSELVPKINSWLRVHPNAPMHIQDLLLDIMVNYCFLHQQMFQLAQIQLKRDPLVRKFTTRDGWAAHHAKHRIDKIIMGLSAMKSELVRIGW